MDEFDFINKITSSRYQRHELIKGVGDDAAVFRSLQDDTVVAVDSFVENVHFTDETLTAWQIGYRLLAVNLSDLAAMGAKPLFYLVSIVIPPNKDDAYLVDIFSGMKKLADKYAIDLIGGDTVSGSELSLSMTVIGSVKKDKARYRSDARDGDLVFVTGSLGDASAGLQLLLKEEAMIKDEQLRKALIKGHQEPRPRVDFSQRLAPLKRLALNDISDGIANELHEIANSSDVSIEIEDGAIPISDGLRLFTEEEQFHFKYFGGEDFELVGTVSKKDFPFVQAVGKDLGIKVTEIGSVSYTKDKKNRVFIKRDGKITELEKHGYVHRSREKDE